MKAKKIISIALAIAMLLMTPTQAVFAEGQQEVTEDANIEKTCQMLLYMMKK